MLPQSHTEQILERRLTELGGQLHRAHTVTGLTTTTDGASVTVTGPQGTPASVAARFVVGADGMHSVVREAVGIDFPGGNYPQAFVLADVRMTWPLPDNEVQLFFSPDGLVVVAPLPDGRHRIGATVDHAAETPAMEDIQALLDSRGPEKGARMDSVLWSSRFHVHHRLAASYHSGPVFLAGNAAHVHSPAGGQGMNTGIQDAIDLGGTLAQVLGGAAPESALDGYQRRRRPVAQSVVSMTDRMTRMATLRAPGARVARNLAISLASRSPALRQKIATQIAELPGPESPRSVAPDVSQLPNARGRYANRAPRGVDSWLRRL
jgi:2-polyprenyl-6-methoxyphenol hydroxylase-like FAD-dependent oxidoreductase